MHVRNVYNESVPTVSSVYRYASSIPMLRIFHKLSISAQDAKCLDVHTSILIGLFQVYDMSVDVFSIIARMRWSFI